MDKLLAFANYCQEKMSFISGGKILKIYFKKERSNSTTPKQNVNDGEKKKSTLKNRFMYHAASLKDSLVPVKYDILTFRLTNQYIKIMTKIHLI